jgi:hypothetical protein
MTPDHRMPQWLKVQANDESASKRSNSKPTDGRRRYLMLFQSLELFAKPAPATERSTSLMRLLDRNPPATQEEIIKNLC